MPSLERPRALFEKVAVGSRHKVSAVQNELHRRILFARLGRLSYEQRGGSSNGGVGAKIDRLMAELTKLDPAADDNSMLVTDVADAESTEDDRVTVATSAL